MIMAALEELYRSFRVADAIDIALVTVFIYAALTWFKETTSRWAFVGVALLAIVYLAARTMGMHMTVFLFQAVFAVLLVALVVVFQEDLRRAFERLAAFPTARRLRPAADFAEIDALVEAASDLARKRIGALVVLKGNEPLDRHLDGGIFLDAHVSKPILESIFDPHSMGHDGAVVIEGRRIRQFAAHLPLSKNLKEVGPRGTRHSAALGLSECSDALVVVVSEERGEISVAEHGKLAVTSAANLKGRLVHFAQVHYPQQARTFLTRLVRENARLKVASLLFACLAWYLMVHKAEIVQHTYPAVPIEFVNRTPGIAVADPTPNRATVTLRGHQHAFNLLVPSKLAFVVDLAGLQAGTYQITLDADRLKGADEVEVEQVIPPTITLTLERPESASLTEARATVGP